MIDSYHRVELNRVSTSETASVKATSPVTAASDNSLHTDMNELGAFLWGSAPNAWEASGQFDYVRSHAEQAIEKVMSEDLNKTYIATKQVQDVRIYKPIPRPTTTSDCSPPPATNSAPARYEPTRVEYRGVTRVPGTIDTILELLAAKEEREAYWVALNTIKGFVHGQLFNSQRLNEQDAFPRWNQKYLAARYTKYPSTRVIDTCFAEYATYKSDPTSEFERAFVYRRSVDDRCFAMNEVEAKMAKYEDDCNRFYIQDWLYEVSETKEKHVCKVVLTCNVFLPINASTAYDKQEFREFCTTNLVSLRMLLIKQWREQMTNAVGSASMLFAPWKRGQSSQSRCCGVCSAAFSLLRKRNTCYTCDMVVCSKCCVKLHRSDSLSSTSSTGSNQSGFGLDGSHRRTIKECTLCNQFGCDGTVSRVSISIRRQFTKSVTPYKSASTTELDDDLDLVLSDDDHDQSDTQSVKSDMSVPQMGPSNLRRCASMGSARASGRVLYPGPTMPTRQPASTSGVVLFAENEIPSMLNSSFHNVSRASPPFRGKRAVRAVSEDNVLLTRHDELDEELYSEDDLANFNLQLL
ncbi:TPA: hypothetical protein N0F65_006445 [Lagenidium giganteum]|uniref:FYVE-type domain-containing protein n=1 Tax=Lagenidium giganteum TaxID=4803 RepID=A0AAV2Z2L2_9STRA|nr:TPA: hypothetical protein N0F65_006445 [Lagenidium giganteum]